jgi:hypothetical protein
MSIDLTTVHRIHTERGSHIEPPLNEAWSNLEKLRWNLAVALHDAGQPINLMDVRESDYRVNGVPQEAYDVTSSFGTSGAIGFHSTWTFINGLGFGLSAAARMEANQ